MIHESIAEGLDFLVQGAGDIADQAHTQRAETRLLMVAEGVVEERSEGFHVLEEFLFQGTSNSTNSGKDDIGNTRLGRQCRQDLQ